MAYPHDYAQTGPAHAVPETSFHRIASAEAEVEKAVYRLATIIDRLDGGVPQLDSNGERPLEPGALGILNRSADNLSQLASTIHELAGRLDRNIP
jgi:hypothetical protein